MKNKKTICIIGLLAIAVAVAVWMYVRKKNTTGNAQEAGQEQQKQADNDQADSKENDESGNGLPIRKPPAIQRPDIVLRPAPITKDDTAASGSGTSAASTSGTSTGRTSDTSTGRTTGSGTENGQIMTGRRAGTTTPIFSIKP